MKPNEGSADRAIRVMAGIAFLVVAIFGAGMLEGHLAGIALGVVGLVSLVTGAAGICPAYSIVGVNTCGVSDQH